MTLSIEFRMGVPSLLVLLTANFAFGAIPLNELGEDVVDYSTNYAQNSLIADFDRLAESYVYEYSRKSNRKVSWWDLYGRHSHLRDRPQYSKYKVDIRSDSFVYDHATSVTSRPKVIQTKTFQNGASHPIASLISWESRQISTSKWTVTEGFKAEWEVEIDSKIPAIENQPKNKTTVSLGTSRDQIYAEQDLFKISYSIIVPPKTELKATWLIVEKEVEVPFQVRVYVKGYVAIWLSEKLDGHWLWFHPISWLAGGKFSRFEDGLVYTVKGVYRGVRGLDSNIKTEEKVLNLSPARHLKAAHGLGE